MLNLLFRIFAALAVFIAIVMLIGSLIPRSFETTSSVVIDSSPEKIFPYINRIRLWSEWTMWNPHDITELKVEYSGSEEGEGAVQSWTEPRGKGKLWITESVTNQSVNFTSSFANFPDMQSSLTLIPQDEKTRVTWISTGSLPPGPFYGWFGLTFSDSLNREYKKSLDRLQRLVEMPTHPETPPADGNSGD
ncbi:MAG: SRPBCC family protein [Pirellulaceae bacterium]